MSRVDPDPLVKALKPDPSTVPEETVNCTASPVTARRRACAGRSAGLDTGA